MEVLIAQSWITSANRLSAADAKRAWEFYERYQDNPAHPGLSLERLTQARDRQNTWSGRISQGLRAVLHQDGATRAVLYAGQHDDAYAWARTHRFERNAATGALQIVTAPEEVERDVPPRPARTPGRFDEHQDAYLLSLGLPPDWLPTIRQVTTDDQLESVLSALPEEVAERLLDVAYGKLATPPAPLPLDRPPMESADTRRGFFQLQGEDELRQILEAPLASWLVFLHPSQRRLATGAFNGPLKVTGSAGTGKTVVAMHRARHLAARGKRVLLTSYVTTLCEYLESGMRLLCSDDELSRVTVHNVHKTALDLLHGAGERVQPVNDEDVRALLAGAAARAGCPFDAAMLFGEWEAVVQAQGLASWDEYRGASRAGRGTPLSVRDRKAVWSVMEDVQGTLRARGLLPWSGLCRRARELLQQGAVHSPFDAVVADEVQDLGAQELLFLAALAGAGLPDRPAGKPLDLMLAGDGGQRIYGRVNSLKALGIDVRGRSHVLRLNYRTSEQIRRFADRVIAHSADDLEGGRDDRRGVRSLFGGPRPVLRACASVEEQERFVVQEIERLLGAGLRPEEIAVFAPRNDHVNAMRNVLRAARLPCSRLGARDDGTPASVAAAPGITVATMHRAKGLEYKVVFVVAVSDDHVPAPRAYKHLSDPAEREAALQGERQLLYVSITRARDEVYLSWAGEPSRFLPKA